MSALLDYVRAHRLSLPAPSAELTPAEHQLWVRYLVLQAGALGAVQLRELWLADVRAEVGAAEVGNLVRELTGRPRLEVAS